MRKDLSLSEIARRVASIPNLLEQQLRAPLPDADRLSAIESWDVVGIGASEGPARLLTCLLSDMGLSCRLVPLSNFREREHAAYFRPEHERRGLIIFSQGLSPNAQLALHDAKSYTDAVLFTSVDDQSRESRARLLRDFAGVVIGHGPHEEAGSLVRFAGPMAATLAAVRFALLLAETRQIRATWGEALCSVPGVYRAALADAGPLGGALSATLTAGPDLPTAQALMWKWQEALYTPLPPAFDVLAFAHGPLQAYFDQAAFFLILERPGSAHRQLWQRFEGVLNPERHRVLRLLASLPGPLAAFEFDAFLNARLLAEMNARAIDPGHWPAQEMDGPLYSLSTPPPSGELSG